MSEKKRRNLLHHRGKVHQMPIYLGKQFRSFFYMNDWKMLPMAAVIAALVSMVIRRRFFITMEGTLVGAFALTCVAIWNGCFNSIQVVCRERPIIKREHRSGMRVFSYVLSNMIYQAAICLAQTVITVYVLLLCGVKIPSEGFMTPWLGIDIGITIFLITYASDMLSLLISSIAHTTTSAMTVMPFVLIFQLVFSGSIFNLPQWAEKVSDLTISRYGLTCIATQADYNSQRMTTGWTTLVMMEDHTEEGSISLGQIIELAQTDSGVPKTVRDRVVTIDPQAIAAAAQARGVSSDLLDLFSAYGSDKVLTFTVGELIDTVVEVSNAKAFSDEAIDYSFRIGDILDTFDRAELEERIVSASSSAMHKDIYERTEENVWHSWLVLIGFAAFFAILSMVFLSFIDKDKR